MNNGTQDQTHFQEESSVQVLEAYQDSVQSSQFDSLPSDLNTFWSAFPTAPTPSQPSQLPASTRSSPSLSRPFPQDDQSSIAEKQTLASLEILNRSPVFKPAAQSGRTHASVESTLQTAHVGTVTPSLSRSQYTSPTETCTSAETETSIEENAARGVAYISLEAAAESHYVGQSSGATWASLILK